MSKFATPVSNKVALIAGPTASGKSDLAVQLALALKGDGKQAVVINADSAQVYADLQILSARPTEEEMRGVPHCLFGSWDAAQACSAADWAAAAKREIENAHLAGSVPILVGGTGMYIRTLLEGIAPIPAIDSEIRADVRALEAQALYAAVEREDPIAAKKLNAGDTQRLARALEVVRTTGKPLHQWQLEKTGGIAGSVTLAPLVLMPDRDWLYERCERRFLQMMDTGAVQEVERLLARNLPEDLPAMRAIGVPEIAGYLRGERTREEAMALGQQATRNYAKRQFTWLRHQPPEDWTRAALEDVNLRAQFEILFSK